MKFYGALSNYRIFVHSIEISNYYLWSVFHIKTGNLRFYWRKILGGKLIESGEFIMQGYEIKTDKPLNQFPSPVVDEMWKLISISKNWALNNNLYFDEE